MSSFVGTVNGGVALIPDNKRADSEFFFGNDDLFVPPHHLDAFTVADNDMQATWITPWWPANGLFLGDRGVDFSMQSENSWWGRPWVSVGANGRLSFVGITRDANGNILPNATVRCFRTSTDEMVSKVTSDANGFYQTTTPYGDAHYLTIHAATVPPVGGASPDNLTPG